MTRRRSLTVLGSAGAGLWVAGHGLDSAGARTTHGDDYIADAARACTLTAEQEEGPFYVALDRLRENIRRRAARAVAGTRDHRHQLAHVQAVAQRRRRYLALQRVRRLLGHQL
jgi:hypothetical protein